MLRTGPFATIALALLLSGCLPAQQPAPSPPSRPVTRPTAPPPPEPVAAVPAPPPAWQARPVIPNAVEVRASIYTVAPGNTLRGIAEKTGAASEAIARENKLAAPFVIRPGQKLRIPGGRYHRVGKAESGIAIARAYGVDWSRVATMNMLTEPYILRENQRLLIPSRTEVATMTIEQRAAAFRLDIDDLITGGEPALATRAEPATHPASSSIPLAEPERFTGRFGWPLTGPIVRRFGSLGGGRKNDGINIGAAEGTPILAAADGVVAYVGSEVALYGGLILLRHGDGWITAYGHAEELLVKRGQSVKRGQIIARAGETGSATEPQLHFEIRQGRKPVNPLEHLPRRG